MKVFIYARIIIAKVNLVRAGLEAGFVQFIPASQVTIVLRRAVDSMGTNTESIADAPREWVHIHVHFARNDELRFVLIIPNRIWAIFHFMYYEVPDAVSFMTGACSPAVAVVTLALVIVQARWSWPRGSSEGRQADEIQFTVPRKSNVYSVGVDMADVVQGAEDARDPTNLDLPETSSEAREVK